MKLFLSQAVSLFLICLSTSIYAQTERAAFTETGRGAANAFVTDYHALGINPANLAFGNEYNKQLTIGFGQLSFSNYGEGFTKSQLWDAISGADAELTFREKLEAAENFENTVLSLDATVLAFGMALNTQKAGNFSFSIGSRFSFFSKFNNTASSHLWRGFTDPYFDQWIVSGPDGIRDTIANQGINSSELENVILGYSSDPQLASDLYDGSVLRAMAYTEYSFGYGKTLFENDDITINAGAGIKYLQGLYILNVAIIENEVISAFTASTPALDIDYGSGANNNPSAVTGSGFKPVGSGFGFDLGLSVELSNQFRVAASITDIGSITFDGNVYSSADTLVYDYESTGLESYNVFAEFDVFAGDKGLFQWDGLQEQKVNLPTQFRLGMGYFHSDQFRFGLDVNLPMNDEPGNIDRMAFAAGVDYIPIPLIRFSAGIGAGDNYGFRVPFGLNFMVGEGAWEFGVATRDILFYLRDDRPNISAAVGFLRFRFGTLEQGSQSRMFE